jgi:hypothetical protein
MQDGPPTRVGGPLLFKSEATGGDHKAGVRGRCLARGANEALAVNDVRSASGQVGLVGLASASDA